MDSLYAILLSSDGHLLDAQDHPDFRRVLEDANVGDKIIIVRPLCPWIARPAHDCLV